MIDPTDEAAASLEQAEGALADGRIADADALAERARALFAAADAEHPDTANASIVRARIAHARSDMAASLAHADTAEAILVAARRAYPDEDVVVQLHGQAVAAAAAALVGLGRYDDAEARAVAMLAEVDVRLGDGDPLAGQLCNLLGIAHKYQARYDDAARRYARALAIAGDDPLVLASLYHNLGGLDHARGEPARAEPHARRAVELREAALGSEHPDVAADVAAWAAILDDLGRVDEAEHAYRRALAVFERTLGDAHHEVGFTLGALGALFAGQARWAGRRAVAATRARRAAGAARRRARRRRADRPLPRRGRPRARDAAARRARARRRGGGGVRAHVRGGSPARRRCAGGARRDPREAGVVRLSA